MSDGTSSILSGPEFDTRDHLAGTTSSDGSPTPESPGFLIPPLTVKCLVSSQVKNSEAQGEQDRDSVRTTYHPRDGSSTPTLVVSIPLLDPKTVNERRHPGRTRIVYSNVTLRLRLLLDLEGFDRGIGYDFRSP